MKLEEHQELYRAIEEITEIAKGFGLDFYPMRMKSVRWIYLYLWGLWNADAVLTGALENIS